MSEWRICNKSDIDSVLKMYRWQREREQIHGNRKIIINASKIYIKFLGVYDYHELSAGFRCLYTSCQLFRCISSRTLTTRMPKRKYVYRYELSSYNVRSHETHEYLRLNIHLSLTVPTHFSFITIKRGCVNKKKAITKHWYDSRIPQL